jgi:hypothetical protein
MSDFNMGEYLQTLISIGYPSSLNNKIKMRSNNKCKKEKKKSTKMRNNKHEEGD